MVASWFRLANFSTVKKDTECFCSSACLSFLATFMSEAQEGDDGGLGVVRVKPLGAGGGGGESSSMLEAEHPGAGKGQTSFGKGQFCEGKGKGKGSTVKGPGTGVTFSTSPPELAVGGKAFTYPSHVIAPEMDQQALYDEFMPPRVQAFLDGVNVNIMAYGQTGSGKTHTMFGPPGIMGRAAAGEYGNSICPTYGLFPRGLLACFGACEALRAGGCAVILTASAVELSYMGNIDMFSKRKLDPATFSTRGGDQLGVAVDKATTPPRLYGMSEVTLDGYEDLRAVYAALATRNTAGTLMNDSSSRTHCFAFLTLRQHDPDVDSVRTSRFQFVDLAGSER